jgi:SNF2 family DNA or RNA helicase
VYRLIGAGTIEELSYMNALYKQQLARTITSAKSARASHFAALYNADIELEADELFSI